PSSLTLFKILGVFHRGRFGLIRQGIHSIRFSSSLHRTSISILPSSSSVSFSQRSISSSQRRMDSSSEGSSPSTPEGNCSLDFPVHALMPTKETQQEAFLAKYPHYDGRGVLMAILDTGVDPALPGMQVTSTGERKLVDVMDLTGAGDVDTSTVKTSCDGVIEGLTGTKLKIPDTWTNPSGKYHIGSKPLYELYPKGLLTLVRKETKDEKWKSCHQLATADALKQLTSHEDTVGATTEKLKDKLERENLVAQLEFLRSQDKVEDKGPVMDVITWNDGKKWMSCLDTSLKGDLASCKPMASFRVNGEYGTLTPKDDLTYNFSISSNGNLTEICVPTGSHGSHVANIAGGFFPDDKAKNGLAPGVKIVSMNIGDGRLSSMETGQALTRAFDACAQMGVDIVNMSFGEYAHIPDQGRVIDQLKKLVEKHGVVFVSSAGNNGPALSTVGAPGGTTSTVLGVSAFLTPDMADPMYGIYSKNVPNNLFGWSSRGPSADGSLGVSISAPGAAVTGVPKYCRKTNQLMNGTSMSSPNAAGAISCLISARKAEGAKPSVPQIRLALENTGKETGEYDKLSIGNGLVQIDSAYEWLKALPKGVLPDTIKSFDVKCVRSSLPTQRGIYLRDAVDTSAIQEFAVTVQPLFGEQEATDGVNFERLLRVSCKDSFVRCASTLILNNQPCKIMVEVDPTQLPPNQLHYSEIELFDAEFPSLGPIVRIPVTITKPLELTTVSHSFDALTRPGIPIRNFIKVPEGATAALIRLKNIDRVPKESFVIHCTQLLPHKSMRESETHRNILGDQTELKRAFNVVGGKTLEICLVRTWAREKKEVAARVEIEFVGISSSPSIALSNANLVNGFQLKAWEKGPVEIQPTLSLKQFVQVVKPFEVKLQALTDRDVFHDGTTIHRLLLNYKLNVAKGGDFQMELGGLTDYLYEAPLDCMLVQIFSATKEFVGASSSYPGRYTHKLDKGEYRIQVQLRHANENVLDRLRDTPLSVINKLSSSISLDLYTSPIALVEGDASKKVSSTASILPASHSTNYYVPHVADEKMPKGVSGGSFFRGTMMPYGDTAYSSVAGVGIPVVFTINEYGKRQTKTLAPVTLTPPKKSIEQEMSDAFRDVQIEWIEKSKEDKAGEALYEKLIVDFPSHLPVHLAMLRRLSNKKKRTSDDHSKIISITSKILELTKPNEVLQWMGAKHDNDEEGMALKTSMEERKGAIVDALLVRAAATTDAFLCGMKDEDIPKSLARQSGPILEKKEEKKEGENGCESTPPSQPSTPRKENTPVKNDSIVVTEAQLSALIKELYQWIDPSDAKALLITAKYAATQGHFGKCLKHLQKLVDETNSNGKDAKQHELLIADICDYLGLYHISQLHRNRIQCRHRPTFRLF
ncbi:tpp-2, partial [Pristionchus pacificus]